MSYASIEITEVGPPEFPLIQVLRDTIFAEYGHRITVPFAQQAEGRQDLIALIAHLEGNPVGYKVGYRDKPGVFHSLSGGVLPDYRGYGVARRMQDFQHGLLCAREYKSVWFNTFNKFRHMLLFGLDTGFLPIGVEIRLEGEIAIAFRKELTRPDPESAARSVPATGGVHVESVSPTYHGLLAQLATDAGMPADENQIDAEVAGGGVALLAYVEGRPAGFAVLRPANDDAVALALGGQIAGRRDGWEIRLIGVHPAQRLRGVGSALMRHALASAGGGELRTAIPNDRVAALRLAIREGFRIAGVKIHNEPRGPFVVEMRQDGDAPPAHA